MIKKKSPPNGRLTNFICVDKKRLSKELTEFKQGVKSKEEVEATASIFFELIGRLNGGIK